MFRHRKAKGPSGPDVVSLKEQAAHFHAREQHRLFQHFRKLVMWAAIAVGFMCGYMWRATNGISYRQAFEYGKHHYGVAVAALCGGFLILGGSYFLATAQEMEAHHFGDIKRILKLFIAALMLPIIGIGLLVHQYGISSPAGKRVMVLVLMAMLVLTVAVYIWKVGRLFPALRAEGKRRRSERRDLFRAWRRHQRELRRERRQASKQAAQGEDELDGDPTGPLPKMHTG